MLWLDRDSISRLQRAYGLKMKLHSLKNKALPCALAGIREIALSFGFTTTVRNFYGRGNDAASRNGSGRFFVGWDQRPTGNKANILLIFALCEGIL